MATEEVWYELSGRLTQERDEARAEITRLRREKALLAIAIQLVSREKKALVEALTALVEPDRFDAHPQDYMPVWHRARAALRAAIETKDGQS